MILRRTKCQLRPVSRLLSTEASSTEAAAPKSSSIGSRFRRGWKSWYEEVPFWVKFGDVAVAGAFSGITGYVLYEKLHVPDQVYNAVKIAGQSEIIQDRIGFPMSISRWGWNGTIRDDRFSLEIPISGPRGSGKLFIQALKTGELEGTQNWTVMLLQAEFNPATDVEKELWAEKIPRIDLMYIPANGPPALAKPKPQSK
jgi:hypothetical protein